MWRNIRTAFLGYSNKKDDHSLFDWAAVLVLTSEGKNFWSFGWLMLFVDKSTWNIDVSFVSGYWSSYNRIEERKKWFKIQNITYATHLVSHLHEVESSSHLSANYLAANISKNIFHSHYVTDWKAPAFQAKYVWEVIERLNTAGRLYALE